MTPPAPQRKRNIHQIYKSPLPLEIFPVPTFNPQNPLSIFHVLFTCLYQAFFPPCSHPKVPLKGYISEETRSVHVTDQTTIRILWEKGFFGKGSFSRSEPTWLDGEKRRRGISAALTSEEVTAKRREERRKFKLDRAKKEQDDIAQRLKDERKSRASAGSSLTEIEDLASTANGHATSETAVETHTLPPIEPSETKSSATLINASPKKEDSQVAEPETVIDREHLQLDPNEAFFLAFALGILRVYPQDSPTPLPIPALLSHLRRQFFFPPLPPSSPLLPDDPFLISYAAYHHFRSLGWVVRPGIKFGVDLLLYNRGPVFSHAEFAIVVLPDYSRWPEEVDSAGRKRQRERRPWWWLHCVNRVQTQVRKSTILAYVKIPSPEEAGKFEGGDVRGLLGLYEIREIGLKRWLPNRSR